jgi:hypothetical protein
MDEDYYDIGAEELIGADDDEDFLGIFGDDEDDEIGWDDDDVGAEELVGADFVGDFIGARGRRGRRRRRPPSRRARALASRRRGLREVKKPATAGRQIFFGANAVGTAGQLILQATVQEICRPVRMVIEAFVTADGTTVNTGSVLISDIKVGTISQFTALQSLPASMFRADSTAMNQGFLPDTIQPGTNYAVILASTAAANTYAFAVSCRTLR